MYICACLKPPAPHGAIPDKLLKQKVAGEFEKKKFSVEGFVSEGWRWRNKLLATFRISS